MTELAEYLYRPTLQVQQGPFAADVMYCHYPRQTGAKRGIVELDLEDGTLRVGYAPENGSWIPEAVYHNRRLRWYCAPVHGKYVEQLLNEIVPYAQTILDDSTVEWDGYKHVGVLGHDARVAAREIDAILNDYDLIDNDLSVVAYEAQEWYAEDQGALAEAEEAYRRGGLAGVEAWLLAQPEDGTEDTPFLTHADEFCSWIEQRVREP